MNIQRPHLVPIREFASAKEMQAFYADLRQRNAAPRTEVPGPLLRQGDLKPAIQLTGGEPANARQIIGAVSRICQVSHADIVGPRRTVYIVIPRQAAMVAVYIQCPHLSLPQIGSVFRRDHTTVLHAIRKLGAWPHRQWPPELFWLRKELDFALEPKEWNGEGCA